MYNIIFLAVMMIVAIGGIMGYTAFREYIAWRRNRKTSERIYDTDDSEYMN